MIADYAFREQEERWDRILRSRRCAICRTAHVGAPIFLYCRMIGGFSCHRGFALRLGGCKAVYPGPSWPVFGSVAI